MGALHPSSRGAAAVRAGLAGQVAFHLRLRRVAAVAVVAGQAAVEAAAGTMSPL
jgi:hypothetical protein